MAEPATDPAGEPDPQSEGEGNVVPLRQLKIDGLAVTDVKLQITGGISVSQELVEKWKIGKPIELRVIGHIDSRVQKARTQYGDPTGDAQLRYTIVIHDLASDDESE